MLPPVDPKLLEQNPSFAILYKDLCTRKLNAGGSTRDTKKQRIHDEIRRNLKTARTNLYTSHLILSTLSDLPSKSASKILPPELHAVIELITAQLSGQIPDSDRAIVSGDVEFFLDHVSIISEAMSGQLEKVAELLCRVCDPTSPPPPSQLPHQSEILYETATSTLPSALSSATLTLANTAHEILTLHRQTLESSIRILEQTMHGSLARATRAKSEVLHSKASLLALQARIQTLTHPPPPEFLAALRNFKAQQSSTEMSLRDREALARQALELYERAGEKGMRDVARRAKFLQGEILRTREDIAKLECGE